MLARVTFQLVKPLDDQHVHHPLRGLQGPSSPSSSPWS